MRHRRRWLPRWDRWSAAEVRGCCQSEKSQSWGKGFTDLRSGVFLPFSSLFSDHTHSPWDCWVKMLMSSSIFYSFIFFNMATWVSETHRGICLNPFWSSVFSSTPQGIFATPSPKVHLKNTLKTLFITTKLLCLHSKCSTPHSMPCNHCLDSANINTSTPGISITKLHEGERTWW